MGSSLPSRFSVDLGVMSMKSYSSLLEVSIIGASPSNAVYCHTQENSFLGEILPLLLEIKQHILSLPNNVLEF